MGLCSWICCYCIIGKFNSIAIRKKITSSLYATNVWTLFEHRNRDEVFKAPFYQYFWLLKTVRFRSAALFFLWDFCEVNICKNLRVFCFMHSIWRQGYYSKNNGIASHLTRYNAVILKSSHFSLKSGPGGNRTRVQKPVPCTSTIIVSYLTFPLPYEN